MELNKIYNNELNMSDLGCAWNEIKAINRSHDNYTHGRDEVVGRKLSEIICRLSRGNNVDYILRKQI